MNLPTDISKPGNRGKPLGNHAVGGRSWLGGLTMLLAIAATLALALYQFVPPTVVPAGAPATEFSAERAMAHLEVIAREPHPVGSPENARVRDYLIHEISAMGLRPQVQKTTVFPSGPDDAAAVKVENILIRIEGTEPASRAVLITAHYDSVVTGPGAGDNGMSVAAMLETLQALKAGPPLRNDLIFLCNDGEEPGMFGSTAFVEQHPWAKDVSVAFDFDRDAPTGAANLSWTTAHDGWLVSEIANASPGIYGASFDNASQRQEYDNDLNALAAAELTGAHFDSFSGQDRYHTMRDNFASADPRALQDVGDIMVALMRHFGSVPIDETKAEDEVFFTLFGGSIVHYPLSWALPLGLLAGLGTFGVIALGVWRRRLSVRGLAGALVVLTLGAVAAAGAAVLAGQLILAAHPEAWVLGEGDFYGQGFYMGALYAFTVALALALWSWIGRRLEAAYLTVAALFWLGVLAVFYAIASPHGSFALAWPALAGVLALGVFVELTGDGSWRSWARGAALLVPALLTIGFLMPLLYSATLDGFEAGLADKGAFLVLLLGLLAPQLSLIAHAFRGRWLPAAATLLVALIGVGLLLAGNAASGYDAAHPRPDTLFYSLNTDTGEASWATLDPELDQWTKQFLSGDTQERTVGELYGGDDPTKILTSSAPIARFQPPELELLGQEEANGTTRTLQLHLSSPRGAWKAYLLPGPGVEILGWGANGEPPQEIDDKAFEYRALPPEGVDLSVKVRASGPARFTVIDQTHGLPRIPGETLPKRPETVMPAPLPTEAEAFAGYPALVTKSFVFSNGGTP
jgi:hypothetical protein